MTRSEGFQDREDLRGVSDTKEFDHIVDEGIIDESEGISNMLKAYGTVDRILFEKRQCISESSSCDSCDEF